MKKITISSLALTMVLGASLPLYAANEAQAHEGHQHEMAKTQLKVVDGIQVAVDIQTMAEHMKMMKMMDMKMPHQHGLSHFVTVTLSDKKNKTLIKDASVKIKIFGPDKKTIGAESGTPMEVMAGKGMHHYAYGFNRGQKGMHSAILLFKVKDTVHKTTFAMNIQ